MVLNTPVSILLKTCNNETDLFDPQIEDYRELANF